MATTAYPHSTVLAANLNFSQPNVDRPSEAEKLQGLLYAVIGTALGLLTGTAAVVGSWGTNTAVMARESAEVRISAPGSGSSVPQNAWRSDTIQQQVGGPVSENSAPVLVQATPEMSATHHTAVSTMHHAVSNSFTKRGLASAHKVAFTGGARSLSMAPAAFETAEASEPAASDSASNPAQTRIEGDLTVADFDASTGTLETREGRSFSVSPASSVGNSNDWQDYAGNVHYQCTQAGSCSLTGSGVASSATLI